MQRTMLKRKIIFKFLISGMLLGYLLFAVEWPRLFFALTHANLFYFCISAFVTLIATIPIAFKYYILIKNSIIELPITALVKIILITRFYSIFLPSGVGAEAVKWYKVTRNKKGRGFFLASTLFERMTFILTILIFGGVPLLLSKHPELVTLRNHLLPLILAAFVLISIVMIIFIASGRGQKNYSIFSFLIPSRWKKKDLLLSSLNTFTRQKLLFPIVASVIALSIVWHLMYVLQLFLLFKSCHLSLSITDVAWIGSLVLLLQVLPISFAGLGVRESAYAFFVTLFNYSSENGVLIGLLFFIQMLLLAACGGILELLEKY